MNDLGMLLMGAVARATALAAVGAALAVCLRRRGPSAVALAALATLSGLVAVSALSLSPWPRFWTFDPDARPATVRQAPASRPALTGGVAPAPPVPAGEPLAPVGATFEELARAFVRELRSGGGAPTPAARSAWRWPAWVASGLIGASALALARLGLALRGVAALRARSRRLADAGLLEEVDVLRAELGCTRAVEARETDDLATPATVGWVRPALLLPADWRSWDAAERRAVLAHELAHVRRADYLWGLWAQACLAVHAYHPLAHWLAARLRLEQELAADAWGARLSGGNRPYLEALARLALRRGGPLESPPRLAAWPARPFLPTRGTLLRRIEMLRDAKTNPLPTAPMPPLGRAATVAALAAAGLLVAGLRGPDSDARAQQAAPALAADAGATPPAAPKAAAIDVTRAPREASMVIAGRPAEIFNDPAFRGLAASIDAMPGVVGSLGIKVEEVEAFAVYVFVDPAALGPARVQNPDALVIAPVVTVVTTGPDAAKALAAKLNADVRSRKYGPGGAVATPDDRTVIVGRESALRKVLAARGGPEVRHAWADAWSKVDKGQLAFAVDASLLAAQVAPARAAQPGRPPDPAQALAATLAPFAPLWERAVAYAVGLDLKGGLKVDLVAHGSTDRGARQVAETIEAIRTLGKNALSGYRRREDEAPRRDRAILGKWLDLVEPLLANVKERPGDDPRFVEYRSQSDADVAGVVGAMLPAVAAARSAAFRAQSTNNMKQIGLAMHNYESVNGHFPPAAGFAPGSKVPHSWRVAILPYIEQNDLYKQYDFNEPWDGPKNRTLLDRMPKLYGRPGDAPDPTRAAYFVVTGPATLFPPGSPGLEIAAVTDGTSNTIMTVEAKRDVPWTKPEDIPYDAAKPLPELGGFHDDGFLAGFADGSVRYLSKQVNEAVLRAILTRAGGEVVSADALGPNRPPAPHRLDPDLRPTAPRR